MTSALVRLLTLVALLFMPFGMAVAPAVAQAAPAEHATMPMGHCEQQPGQDKAPVSKMDCAAMCTALPAAYGAALAPAMKPKAQRRISLVTPFTGVVLEIATPPPRQA
jgi:hypothetical protein